MPLNCSNSVKGLGVAKVAGAIGFEGMWGGLAPQGCFEGQWLTGYLGLVLVFVWGGARRGGLISVFQEFSTSIGEAFILAGGLGAGVRGHRNFPDISKFPKILSLKSFGNSYIPCS